MELSFEALLLTSPNSTGSGNSQPSELIERQIHLIQPLEKKRTSPQKRFITCSHVNLLCCQNLIQTDLHSFYAQLCSRHQRPLNLFFFKLFASDKTPAGFLRFGHVHTIPTTAGSKPIASRFHKPVKAVTGNYNCQRCQGLLNELGDKGGVIELMHRSCRDQTDRRVMIGVY